MTTTSPAPNTIPYAELTTKMTTIARSMELWSQELITLLSVPKARRTPVQLKRLADIESSFDTYADYLENPGPLPKAACIKRANAAC
ncbi:hypothetical protein [Granulicella paludicola]|uniref:hypothetical protein n=1 Tax=Granulicella paludicola TaxID=474951 RepID=UPI0021E09B21|nr:hypothetical protein [Granulicella paludicola]